MTIEPEVTFRGVDHSDQLVELVNEKAEKLAAVCPQIRSCSVVIDLPHRHHHQGRHFHVRIVLAVPGTDLVVAHEPSDDGSFEDAHFAVNHAFASMRRRLESHMRRQRDGYRSAAPDRR